jgi:predicted short-subunit dehydrogenase-like oxidoreductase (DUF2520 family)
MDRIESAVLIGSGNVATHMGIAFAAAGIRILQVYSRNLDNAETLALKLSCEATSDLDSLPGDADLYVIAVSDDAIPEVVTAFPLHDKLLVHTSGSTEMQLLQEKTSRYGVFYPLQTFSRDVPIDFSRVPLCLEASDAGTLALLEDLAFKLSENVSRVSTEQRRKLHLAAVFACNFVNHMYAQAAEVLKDNDLLFELLRPLISETARKVMMADPKNVQTGPARRHNKGIIEKHLEMLEKHPGLQEMYQFVSKSIMSQYRSK